MNAAFDLDFLRLFIIFILPGLISMWVYRHIMPAYSIKWGEALLQGLFYSCINYAIFSPVIWWMHIDAFPLDYPLIYGVSSFVVLFVGPVSWPLIYIWLVRKTDLFNKFQLPYPSSWDYYFDKREPSFVLVHLKTGKLVGGYFGTESYATSFPNQGDLYLEAVYKISDDGVFGEPIEGTDGLIIRKDEYHYVELFNVPNQNSEEDKNE